MNQAVLRPNNRSAAMKPAGTVSAAKASDSSRVATSPVPPTDVQTFNKR